MAGVGPSNSPMCCFGPRILRVELGELGFLNSRLQSTLRPPQTLACRAEVGGGTLPLPGARPHWHRRSNGKLPRESQEVLGASAILIAMF